MILIAYEIPISIYEKKENYKKIVAKSLFIKEKNIKRLQYLKRSIDIRNKNRPFYKFSIKIEIDCNLKESILKKYKAKILDEFNIKLDLNIISKKSRDKQIAIIGSGPAGLFSALILSEAGFCPTIYERGKSIEERDKDIKKLFENSIFNEESNICYGEGGAGTYSDGKLTSRKNHVFTDYILEKLVEYGADKDILIDSKPHIGSDILKKVIINFRKDLISRGCKFKFNSKLTDLKIENSILKGIYINNDYIPCDRLVLAIGNSARDSFKMLYKNGLKMSPKPFAVGVRIEHSREFIDIAQYGSKRNINILGHASYSFVKSFGNSRSCYTFCMCPGGEVVPAMAEKNRVAVNGMSYNKRDLQNSNSAIVVNVKIDDFYNGNALDGINFQDYLEKKAFDITKSYKALFQNVSNFLNENRFSTIKSSYRLGIVDYDFNKFFPKFIVDNLKLGLYNFDKKMKGFINNAILVGPETKTSSAIRIDRNKQTFESDNIKNIYPCGEGAGYSGGIISSALDGIKVAKSIISSLE